MSRLGRIASLYRYPIKTMQGESADRIEVTELGFEGDRLWALRDERRGDFGGGKRIVPLMNLRAHSGQAGAPPEIELPDGERFRADDPRAAERISEALSHPVTIWPVGATPDPPDEVEGVEDLEADFRAAMGREGSEPNPDFSAMPEDMMGFLGREGRPYVDLAPLMVMTQQSLDSLAKAASSSRIDVRRFRPSILIEAETEGEFPEQDWVGARVRIGGTVLRFPMTCPRCVMTTRGFADLPKDPGIMRKLVSHAQGNLGVYATIEESGSIAVGDDVVRLD